MERIRNFLQDESGATAVEYSLMVALISIACAVAIRALGINLDTVFTNVKFSGRPASIAPPLKR
jgi:pilus assembly protein Flp/PilA